jgi:DNA invertase Pin-like site-specific DNA recombinase
VSTGGQNLDRQIDALTRARCRRIFADKKSGKDTDRPELAAALNFMQPATPSSSPHWTGSAAPFRT